LRGSLSVHAPPAAIFFGGSASLLGLAKGAKMTAAAMSRYLQQNNQTNAKPRRTQFADGSAVVTYLDGSGMILEGALAKSTILRESRPEASTHHPTLSPFEAERVNASPRVAIGRKQQGLNRGSWAFDARNGSGRPEKFPQ